MNLLRGDNIILRAIEPSDLDLLYRWENDPDNWLISNTISPFSKHVLKKYIESAHQDIFEARQLRLMIDRYLVDSGETETIGTIDLFDFDPINRRAGIGILVGDKTERMKGLASSALELLINYSFNRLHLHQLHCIINEENIPSLKLFRKFGFRESGRRSDWIREGQQWKAVLFLQLIRPGDQ